MPQKENIKKARSFDELAEAKYGRPGTKTRERFDKKAKDFIASEMPKDVTPSSNYQQDLQQRL